MCASQFGCVKNYNDFRNMGVTPWGVFALGSSVLSLVGESKGPKESFDPAGANQIYDTGKNNNRVEQHKEFSRPTTWIKQQ